MVIGLLQQLDGEQVSTLGVSAGSGGPSGCATEHVLEWRGERSCAGYAKPDWAERPRWSFRMTECATADISLFAATGVFGHYYVYCWTNKRAVVIMLRGSEQMARRGRTNRSPPRYWPAFRRW